jgi:3-deoxy-manno-octulosonate cytidylyltransferase (CMP-KDO synthetase)
MNVIGIIPARMGSSRFPGKPLAKILGVPMLGHVYLRSKMCASLSEVYVATCDKEIAEYVKSIGGKCVMTKDSHQRASDRVAEAAQKVERAAASKTDIVVMIQGDEPMIYPRMIEEAIGPFLKDKSICVTNLMASLKSAQEQNDSNTIKVVVDLDGFALYFSREPIPSWKRGGQGIPMFKQVCIIPFRRDFLNTYIKLTPTPLEIAESVDMLRVLEHGYKVKMVHTKYQTCSVDTVADLRITESLLKKDSLVPSYCHRVKRKHRAMGAL